MRAVLRDFIRQTTSIIADCSAKNVTPEHWVAKLQKKVILAQIDGHLTPAEYRLWKNDADSQLSADWHRHAQPDEDFDAFYARVNRENNTAVLKKHGVDLTRYEGTLLPPCQTKTKSPKKTRAPSAQSPMPTPQNQLYFAYGSNMDESQMRARVPGSVVVGTGFLPGHAFIFSGYSERWQGSTANVTPKAGEKVFGVIYALPPGGLDRLDAFEGYPRVYQRKSTAITVNSPEARGRVNAILYYLKQKRQLAPPSDAYVQQILRALKRHGAP